MRRIILIIFASIMFANTGFAEIRILEQIAAGKLNKSLLKGAFSVTRICSNGYEFLITGLGVNTSVTQVFEERGGKSLPAKC